MIVLDLLQKSIEAETLLKMLRRLKPMNHSVAVYSDSLVDLKNKYIFH